MPNPILGKAVLELATDDAALSKGLDVAKAKAQGWSQSVSGAGKAAALAIAGVGAAAGAIVGTMVAAAQSVANQAGEVAKLKREMGLTTEEASKLKYAAGRLNIDTDSLSKSFGILSKSLESAHPSLEKYNIEVVRAKDGHIDMEATLGNVADRFKAMPDGVEKTAVALDIFGKSGKDMLPLLNQGADGLKAMGNEAAKLGLVFDDKTLASAKRLTMAHKDLDDRLEGLRNRIGIAFLPVLADWTGGLTKAADVVLPAVSGALEFLTGTFGHIVDVLRGPVSAAFAIASGVFNDFLTATELGAGGVATDLQELFHGLFGKLLPESVARFAGRVIYELASIPGHVAQVVGSIGEMFDVATGRRPEAGGMLRSLVGDARASGIMGVLADVRDAVEGFAAFIVQKFEQARDKLGPIIAGLLEKFDVLKDRFDALPRPVKDYIETIAVAGVATAVFGDPVLSAAGNIGNLLQGLMAVTGATKVWAGVSAIAAGVIEGLRAAVLAFGISSAVAGGGLAGFGAGLATIVGGIGAGFASVVGAIAGIVFSVPVAIAIIVGGLVFIATHLDDLGQAWTALSGIIRLSFAKVADFLVEEWGLTLKALEDGVNNLIDFVNPVWTMLGNPPIAKIHIDLPDANNVEMTLADLARERTANIRVQEVGNWQTRDEASQRSSASDSVTYGVSAQTQGAAAAAATIGSSMAMGMISGFVGSSGGLPKALQDAVQNALENLSIAQRGLMQQTQNAWSDAVQAVQDRHALATRALQDSNKKEIQNLADHQKADAFAQSESQKAQTESLADSQRKDTRALTALHAEQVAKAAGSAQSVLRALAVTQQQETWALQDSQSRATRALQADQRRADEALNVAQASAMRALQETTTDRIQALADAQKAETEAMSKAQRTALQQLADTQAAETRTAKDASVAAIEALATQNAAAMEVMKTGSLAAITTLQGWATGTITSLSAQLATQIAAYAQTTLTTNLYRGPAAVAAPGAPLGAGYAPGTQFNLGTYGGVLQAVRSIAPGGIPMYAEGTSWVPRTGLAFLHRGEAVIPAAELRNGGRAIHIHVDLDGREIAQVVSDRFNAQGILAGAMP